MELIQSTRVTYSEPTEKNSSHAHRDFAHISSHHARHQQSHERNICPPLPSTSPTSNHCHGTRYNARSFPLLRPPIRAPERNLHIHPHLNHSDLHIQPPRRPHHKPQSRGRHTRRRDRSPAPSRPARQIHAETHLLRFSLNILRFSSLYVFQRTALRLLSAQRRHIRRIGCAHKWDSASDSLLSFVYGMQNWCDEGFEGCETRECRV